MHEYAHLIQDQSTIYGAISFLNLLDRLQDLRRILLATLQPMVLPIRNHPRAVGTWSAFLDEVEPLARASAPWPKDGTWAFQDREVVAKTCQCDLASAVRNYPVVLARFVDHATFREHVHSFGVRELVEGYAVAVEHLHGGQLPTLLESPDFAYLALERVVSALGRYAPEHVVAFAHWALQDPFPGVRLFELLDHVRHTFGGSLPPAHELFGFLRDEAIRSGLAEKIVQVNAAISRFVAHYLPSGERDPLVRTLRWYQGVVSANLARLLDPQTQFPLGSFLCRAHQSWASEDWAALAAFCRQHPLPQIEDGAGSVFTFGASDHAAEGVFVLRGLVDVYERLWSGADTEWACPFHSTCPSEKVPQKDSSCLATPWRKGVIQPYCPYGAASFYLDAFRVDLQ